MSEGAGLAEVQGLAELGLQSCASWGLSASHVWLQDTAALGHGGHLARRLQAFTGLLPTLDLVPRQVLSASLGWLHPNFGR